MFHTQRIFLFALCAAAALVTNASAGDKGFKDLFNGKDLTGWKTLPEKGDKIFSVENDYIKVSGKPAGYFYTDKSFKNYVLKFDWRYKRPDNLEDDKKFGGNSGLLVHITGGHKVWPTSLEVQGANGSHGSFIAIGGKAVGLTDAKFDGALVHKVRNKVGEWNTTEVTIDNGNVIVKLNGTQVNSGKFTLTDGPFGFQSEGSELHFKNIKIKVLPDGAAPKGDKKTETKKVEEKKTETKKVEEKKTETKKVEEKKTETKKVETIPPPTTVVPTPAQPQVEYAPARRGLFPNLRARLRGIFR